MGIPALIWAWREGIWPCPAWSTWPITTCSTCSGSTSARSSAAWIAMPPRSVASREARPPPSLPIGVRAAPRITVLGIGTRSLRFGDARVANAYSTAVIVSAADGDRRDHRRTARDGRRHDRASACSRARRSPTTSTGGALQALVDSGEAKPGLKKVAVAHAGGRRLVLAGLGKRDDFGRRGRAGGRRRRRRRAPRELGAQALCWELPHHVDDAVVAGLVEGTALAAYRFDRFKSKPDENGGIDGAARQRAPRRLRGRRSGRDRRRGGQRRARPPEHALQRDDPDLARGAGGGPCERGGGPDRRGRGPRRARGARDGRLRSPSPAGPRRNRR